MRIIGIIFVLAISGCTVAGNTARHSGAGFTHAAPAPSEPVQPAAEGDYRGKLMEEINAG